MRHELKTPSNGSFRGGLALWSAMTERGWHHIAPVASSAATWETFFHFRWTLEDDLDLRVDTLTKDGHMLTA
jgi:hypothetical protein